MATKASKFTDAPNAASSSVSRYSTTTRDVRSGGSPSLPSIPREWFAWVRLGTLLRNTLPGNGDQAGIDAKALASDEAFVNASPQDRFKEVSEQTVFAETHVPVLRKGRMVWHRVTLIEFVKRPVRQVDVDLFAQVALRTNALPVIQQQHPDHQLEVNRRPTMRAMR